MLTVILRDDGGLTLISDDREAENVRVEGAFAGTSDEWGDELEDPEYADPAVDFEVLEAWRNAPFTDGKLTVEFGPAHTKEIVDALEGAGFMLDDDLLAKVFQHKGGGPKPNRS